MTLPTAALARTEGDAAASVQELCETLFPEGAEAFWRVDELNKVLAQARHWPSRELADVIHRALADERVLAAVDSSGKRVRVALVETLLAMGFPYALEVSPEQLAAYRAEELGAVFSAPVTATVALVSLGYHAVGGGILLGLAGLMVVRPGWDTELLLIAAPFVIGGVHALLTTISAFKRRKRFKVFARLGQAALLGPLFSLIAGGLLFSQRGLVGEAVVFLLAGLVAATPAMITASASARTARRIQDENRRV